MSGLDASFLYFETPTMHMHVCGTLVLDPSTAPGGWTATTVRDLVAERLPHLESFRRKVQPATLWLHHPAWVHVDVDVDAHVFQAQCPAPGSFAELAGVVAEFASRQLDRSRPLWEMLVVEGLQDGRVALVVKIHHSLVDGVGAANVLAGLFDLEPTPRTIEEPPPAGSPAPTGFGRGLVAQLAHTANGIARSPLTVARLVPTATRSLTNLVRAYAGGPASGGAAPFTAPRVAFNGRITAQRSVALVDVPLADLKAVKTATGTTFNDVVLAVCGGAFRHYLEGRGELPDSSLIATCPVSVRDDAGGSDAANQVSAMFATLATDVADPLERLDTVRRSSAAGKAGHQAIGGELLAQAAELAPPTLTSLLSRAYAESRLSDVHPVVMNLVLSNVPGPQFQLYVAGAAVESVFPLGPVLEGTGLNVTVASYRDRVGFGFIACAERMPDIADLAAAVPVAIRELVEACRLAQSA